MAVVQRYATGAKDPAAEKNIDSIYNAGRLHLMNSQIAAIVGDSVGSVYEFGEIPSNAIIYPHSVFQNGAAGGAVNLGFYTPKGSGAIGTVIGTGAQLFSALSVAAGASTILSTGAIGLVNFNRRAWEVAGLAADPGGNLSVCATFTGGPTTAAANINLCLLYSTN